MKMTELLLLLPFHNVIILSFLLASLSFNLTADVTAFTVHDYADVLTRQRIRPTGRRWDAAPEATSTSASIFALETHHARRHRQQRHQTLRTLDMSLCSGINNDSNQVENNDLIVDQEHIEKVRSSVPDVVNGMPEPLDAQILRNKYFFLRHGQSTANVQQIISSSRSLAYSDRHGLTQLGYEQGIQSASKLLDALEQEKRMEKEQEDSNENESKFTSTTKKKVIFISSPFARARQTAEACLDGLLRNSDDKSQQSVAERIHRLGIEVQDDVVIEDLLMERYFGRLDGEAIYTYAYVWPLDKFNSTHTAFDVESVAAVCHRWHQVITKLEGRYDDCYIVLTSHADVLQIGQLYAAHAENVGAFSSYRFQNGEVRPMVVARPDTLPDPVPLDPPERGTSKYQKLSQQQSEKRKP